MNLKAINVEQNLDFSLFLKPNFIYKPKTGSGSSFYRRYSGSATLTLSYFTARRGNIKP